MLTMPSSDLERLRRVYDANRSLWIEQGYEGRWVAIAPDESVIGFYDDYESAYSAATERLGGSAPFLLQEVLPQDRLEQIQLLSWS